MAVKWIEGFEDYTDVNQLPFVYVGDQFGNSSFDTGRSDYGQSLLYSGVAYAESSFSTPDLGNQGTWIVGFAFKHDVLTSISAFDILQIFDGITAQVSLNFDPLSQMFSITRGNGTVLGTGSTVIPNDSWFYVEMKVVIDSSVGTIDLNINEISDISVTGLNTKNSSNSYANFITFPHPNGYFIKYWLDDIYVLDGTGSVNNDLLGDMKVEMLRTSGEGAYTSWSSNNGNIPRWKAVQVLDTNFVSTTTNGNKGTFNFSPLQKLNSGFAAVAVNVFARNSSPSTHTVDVVLKSGATEILSTDQTIDQITYRRVQLIQETDPDTTATWTSEGINAVDCGIKLIS